jgi:hypothetical protein
MTMNKNKPINPSLYDQNPVVWENIIMAGNENLGKLSKIMRRASQLDYALGTSNSAGNWHHGKFSPTASMEKRALAYIKGGYKPLEKGTTLSMPQPVQESQPAPVEDQEEVVLIVVVPKRGKVGSVEKMLKAFGCTFGEA